jgi:hypothetical protein
MIAIASAPMDVPMGRIEQAFSYIDAAGARAGGRGGTLDGRI